MDKAVPGWLLRFAATFLLLWAGCWAAPRLFANLPQFPPTTTDQMQVDVFDRYFRLPAQDVVLVGSSLSYRLKEHGSGKLVGLGPACDRRGTLGPDKRRNSTSPPFSQGATTPHPRYLA